MDRLDYVSMMCNEHAYCLAIEKLLGIDVPIRAQYIRVMFDEITRLLNHLLWLGAHALDVGAMTVFLYCFREREDLMDVYEAVSGARMHAAYYRPGGVYRDLPDAMPQYKRVEDPQREGDRAAEREPPGLAARLHRGLHASASRSYVDEYETLLTDNRIWKQRTGRHRRRHARARAERSASPARCCAARASPGTCARSSPTRSTTSMDFDIPVGVNGDCYDRYLVRVEEMRQSNRIIKQCVDWLRANPGPVITDNHKVAPPSRVEMKIEHGRADPPLQALHRRHPRARRRGLRRGRAPEGRVRHLPRVATAPTSRTA